MRPVIHTAASEERIQELGGGAGIGCPEMRVGVDGVAGCTSLAEVFLLEVSSRFVETAQVEQIVGAVDPVEEVDVRGILVGQTVHGAGAEQQRETEIAVRGGCHVRRRQEACPKQVFPHHGVVPLGPVRGDPPQR